MVHIEVMACFDPQPPFGLLQVGQDVTEASQIAQNPKHRVSVSGFYAKIDLRLEARLLSGSLEVASEGSTE